MFGIIPLLAPAFVSLFWAVTLWSGRNIYTIPARFLSGFMFLMFLIFGSIFIYFAPLPGHYPYIDILFNFFELLMFPAFHFYFRLLTVDKQLSFRTHFLYLAVPVFLTLVYLVAVLITPFDDYAKWLFDENYVGSSRTVGLLDIVREAIKFIFTVQVIIYLLANQWLLIKYGDKAADYYSNERDARDKYAKMLNYSMLVVTISSLIIYIQWRNFAKIGGLMEICWVIMTVSIYYIGFLGIRQKPLNPGNEAAAEVVINDDKGRVLPDENLVASQNQLVDRIRREFSQNKIFLNKDLSIADVARIIGTNRTYLSQTINNQFNQNFSAFVNTWRVEELKKALHAHPEFSMLELADSGGFGSVNSMKRAVLANTGLTFSELKNQLPENDPADCAIKENPADNAD